MTETNNKLLLDLFAAKQEFPVLDKDAENPHFKSKFTPFKAVQTTIDPILWKHNLFIMQWPTIRDGQPALTTQLHHLDGQVMEDTMLLLTTKSDPQAQGSGISYAKRYAYMSILGLVSDEDDDGEAATRARRDERTNARDERPEPRQQRSNGNPDSQEARDELRRVATEHGWDLDKVAAKFEERTGKKLANAYGDDVKAYTNALIGGLVSV